MDIRYHFNQAANDGGFPLNSSDVQYGLSRGCSGVQLRPARQQVIDDLDVIIGNSQVQRGNPEAVPSIDQSGVFLQRILDVPDVPSFRRIMDRMPSQTAILPHSQLLLHDCAAQLRAEPVQSFSTSYAVPGTAGP